MKAAQKLGRPSIAIDQPPPRQRGAAAPQNRDAPVIASKRSRVAVLIGPGPDVDFWLPLLLAARDAARAAADPLLTLAQAAHLVCRSHEAVRLWCEAGLLGHKDDAGRWRIRLSALVELQVKMHGPQGLPAPLQNLVASKR